MKVYHVDEYCEGASHFCFSERKDVVLLEDYEKLREENEWLKRDVELLEQVRDSLFKESSEDKKTIEKLKKKLKEGKC